MTILQGTMQDGTIIPVQVDDQGRLVAEGLDGPAGPAGPTGAKGDQGEPGAKGDPGSMGVDPPLGGFGFPSIVFPENAGYAIQPSLPTGWSQVSRSLLVPTTNGCVASWSATGWPWGGLRRIIINNAVLTLTNLGGAALMHVEINNGGLFVQGSSSEIYLETITGTGFFGSDGSASWASLREIGEGIFVVPKSNGVRFVGSKLSAKSVNHVLVNLYQRQALQPDSSAGSVEISMYGGTSAGRSQLTPAGLAAMNALEAGGWSVSLNS